MATSVDRLLSAGYQDGLDTLAMADLRERRHECHAVETGLSYMRRMIQGRLDIVHAEQARREGGESTQGLEGLIEQLPAILAEHTGGPGRGPLPDVTAPADIDELTAPLDAIVDAQQLGRLPEVTDARLHELVDRLSDLERAVSSQRRSVHELLDVLQAEIVKRYKSGEATVDALLG